MGYIGQPNYIYRAAMPTGLGTSGHSTFFSYLWLLRPATTDIYQSRFWPSWPTPFCTWFTYYFLHLLHRYLPFSLLVTHHCVCRSLSIWFLIASYFLFQHIQTVWTTCIYTSTAHAKLQFYSHFLSRFDPLLYSSLKVWLLCPYASSVFVSFLPFRLSLVSYFSYPEFARQVAGKTELEQSPPGLSIPSR